MASSRFIIRNKTTKKETPLSLRVFLPNKEELVYSIGLKIAPKNWDEGNQKVRNRVEVADIKTDFENRLSEIGIFVNSAVSKLEIKGELSKSNLKNELDIFFKKKEVDKKVETFYEYVEFFTEQSKKRVGKGTVDAYKNTLRLIKEFELEEKYTISFKSINIDFYFLFLEFLEETHDMAPNTIGKQIKNIKTFMNSANEEGITQYSGHRHKHFKVIKVNSYQIYLNEDELKNIHKLDYQLDSVEDRVRDLFLIGCYTGQRVSDWRKLNEQNIMKIGDDEYFKIVQTKTKANVIIPIKPIISDIFKKRNGEAPKFVNSQDINLKLKEIAKKAGIIDKVIEKDNILKFQMVSTHTARRSFCTNAYKSGLDTLSIMKVSGHKTEKSFLTYIKISDEEHAIKNSKHKFFNK